MYISNEVHRKTDTLFPGNNTTAALFSFSVDFIANITPLGGFFLINFSIYHTCTCTYYIIIHVHAYEQPACTTHVHVYVHV